MTNKLSCKLLRWACVSVLTVAGSGSALAFTEPFHAQATAYAYGGPSNSGPGSGNTETATDPVSVNVESGVRWWDCAPDCALLTGAGLAWSRARAEPRTGVLSAAAGAHNTSNGTVTSWDIETPFGTFQYLPAYWGEAQSFAYIRSTWRIASPDGVLQRGDPVRITANLHLSGALENPPRATYAAAMLLNPDTATHWLVGREEIGMGTLRDMIGMGLTFGHVLREGSAEGPVDLAETLSGDFGVGDVVVFESLLEVFAGAPNDGTANEVFSRFDQTLHASLAVTTPGAILVAVPEPGTWVMTASGLCALAGFARRRSSTGRRPIP